MVRVFYVFGHKICVALSKSGKIKELSIIQKFDIGRFGGKFGFSEKVVAQFKNGNWISNQMESSAFKAIMKFLEWVL